MGPEYFWLEIRYSLTRWLLKRYAFFQQENPSRAKLIDIGCGPGNCLRGLPQSVQCFGSDISKPQLKITRAVTGAHVFSSNAENLPVKSGSMDYAILLDVAEHVEDDLKLFNEVSRIIRGSGYVFITAPAYQFLWGSHDELVGHFRRYSKKELTQKVTQAGFEVVEAKYLLPFSFFGLCLLRFLKKAQKKKTDDFFQVSPFFNSLLSTYLFAESTLSRFFSFPWGMIVFVVARKDAKPV